MPLAWIQPFRPVGSRPRLLAQVALGKPYGHIRGVFQLPLVAIIMTRSLTPFLPPSLPYKPLSGAKGRPVVWAIYLDIC